MKNQRSKSKAKNIYGFTLIEAMVFLFIFSVIVMTFYSVLTSGLGYIIESKNRINALSLATEKMEIIHNLKYEDIGTVTGIPSGSIAENEDVLSSGKTFHVKTIVQYVDDALDGVSPADTIPNDYKRVKVTISWEGFKGLTRSVYLVSSLTSPGLEVNSGDGILAIRITNGAGTGVSQARIHIVNNDVSPAVDLTQNTDNLGNLIFPGAKQSIWGYQITASKDDYETVSTVDPGTLDYVPTDDHASVVAGLINTKSITIDKLSDFKIKTFDILGNPIPNVDFHLKGERILGTNNSIIPPETVYKLDSDKNTNSSGELELNDQSPGQIFLSNLESVSGYQFAGISPISGFDTQSNTYKIDFLPDEEKTVEIKFANESNPSLLVKVLNSADDSRLKDAQVKLTNADGYDKTISTSFDGMAFFPDNSDPFIPGSYNLEVTDTGFETHSETVDINNLTTKEIKLNSE